MIEYSLPTKVDALREKNKGNSQFFPSLSRPVPFVGQRMFSVLLIKNRLSRATASSGPHFLPIDAISLSEKTVAVNFFRALYD